MNVSHLLLQGFSPPTEQDGDDDVKEADDTNSKSADDKVSQVSSRPESYTSRSALWL